MQLKAEVPEVDIRFISWIGSKDKAEVPEVNMRFIRWTGRKGLSEYGVHRMNRNEIKAEVPEVKMIRNEIKAEAPEFNMGFIRCLIAEFRHF